MGVHPRPRDGSEISRVGRDADTFLELGQGGLGERSEVLGRSMGGKPPGDGTCVISDEEELQLTHVRTRHAKGEIAREGERVGRRRCLIPPFRIEGLQFGFKGCKESLHL